MGAVRGDEICYLRETGFELMQIGEGFLVFSEGQGRLPSNESRRRPDVARPFSHKNGTQDFERLMIVAGGAINSGDNSYEGAGPHNPLFDNQLPEGRALNRTVTVTLEYEQQD